MEERITELEILLTHQQRFLDELNEALIRSTFEIDDLRKKVARLEAVVRALEPLPLPHGEKPPHY
jgi:uncharacterized coiled-coil protein SlyX